VTDTRLPPVCLLLLLFTLPLAAQEPDVTLHTTVTGNREQPRVMYILPWQQAGDARVEQEFSAGLAGELFEPQDRDEFVQQLNYQATMDAGETGLASDDTDTLLNSD